VLDPISRLCLIDASSFLFAGLGADLSSPPSAMFANACTALDMICKEMLGQDPAVLTRALVTVYEAHTASSMYWKTISLSGIAAFARFLSLAPHLAVGAVDSVFLVDITLSILSGICAISDVAIDILSQPDILTAIYHFTVFSNRFSSVQVIDMAAPQHRSDQAVADHDSDDRRIQILAVQCVRTVSSVPTCRQPLLASGGTSCLFDSLFEYIDTYYERKKKISADSGAESSTTAVARLLPKAPAASSKDSDLDPAHHNLLLLNCILDSLYFLSCEESSVLREALLLPNYEEVAAGAGSAKEGLILKFLLETWSLNIDSLAAKVVAIIMRCGAVPGSSGDELCGTGPWDTLVNSQQVYFLYDIISFRNVSLDPDIAWHMDEHSLAASLAAACSCLRLLLGANSACREAVVVTCEHHMVEGEGGSLPGANLILLLERLSSQFPSAALCIAEIFSWPEVNYRYAFSYCMSSNLLIVLQVLLWPLRPEYDRCSHLGAPHRVSLRCPALVQCRHSAQREQS
jgi:hypothetical protein